MTMTAQGKPAPYETPRRARDRRNRGVIGEFFVKVRPTR